jgi:hypothetical protein
MTLNLRKFLPFAKALFRWGRHRAPELVHQLARLIWERHWQPLPLP